MDRMNLTNPLRIIEDDLVDDGSEEEEEEDDDIGKSFSDNDECDNNNSTEQFDFSVSEIEALNETNASLPSLHTKRNSLLIIEEKDLMMNVENNHRLSLQIESGGGDTDSLVMTNEAINRTIIRIGGGGVDFGESNDHDSDSQSPPPEAINHEIERKSSNDDSNEAIVNILGQINEIVGYFLCLCKKTSFGIFRYLVMAINNVCVCSMPNYFTHTFNFFLSVVQVNQL